MRRRQSVQETNTDLSWGLLFRASLRHGQSRVVSHPTTLVFGPTNSSSTSSTTDDLRAPYYSGFFLRRGTCRRSTAAELVSLSDEVRGECRYHRRQIFEAVYVDCRKRWRR